MNHPKKSMSLLMDSSGQYAVSVERTMVEPNITISLFAGCDTCFCFESTSHVNAAIAMKAFPQGKKSRAGKML